ncbi:hypothetical protein chiPu_0017423 [Chiloscyllium punctatum]|uniref:Uncharacterized protein n=1 Tax=Chiloscyllium punctatum TaxID=137246 RepID=A0A401RFX4_CHIPU|nr:hypothetical protein [Chiloscyllium punctatum]
MHRTQWRDKPFPKKRSLRANAQSTMSWYAVPGNSDLCVCRTQRRETAISACACIEHNIVVRCCRKQLSLRGHAQNTTAWYFVPGNSDLCVCRTQRHETVMSVGACTEYNGVVVVLSNSDLCVRMDRTQQRDTLFLETSISACSCTEHNSVNTTSWYVVPVNSDLCVRIHRTQRRGTLFPETEIAACACIEHNVMACRSRKQRSLHVHAQNTTAWCTVPRNSDLCVRRTQPRGMLFPETVISVCACTEHNNVTHHSRKQRSLHAHAQNTMSWYTIPGNRDLFCVDAHNTTVWYVVPGNSDFCVCMHSIQRHGMLILETAIAVCACTEHNVVVRCSRKQ